MMGVLDLEGAGQVTQFLELLQFCCGWVSMKTQISGLASISQVIIC